VSLYVECAPYGSSGVASKSRWKSRSWTKEWKDNKVPEPSSNIPMRCPFHGCIEVFWKQYLRKHFQEKHVNSTNFTLDYSTMSMHPHEHDYIKSLFENPVQPLTSVCPKKNANSPHDCDYNKLIIYINTNIYIYIYIYTLYIYRYIYIVYIYICIYIYI